MSEYEKWLGELYDMTEDRMQVTRSDAQGIIGAKGDTTRHLWKIGTSAGAAYRYLFDRGAK